MRRAPFFCDRCGLLVRDVTQRVLQEWNFMSADSSKRWRRVHVANLCLDCMESVLEELGA